MSESSPPNVYWTNFYFFSGGFAVKVMLCYETKKSQSHEDFGSFYIFLNKTKRMVLILRIVYNEGFSINPEKTRVARSNARQEVTWIVVNSHMQISKEKRKQIRQQIYYIRKYGLESHLERIEENRANYLNHLLGQINFALFVNPKDEEMKEYFDTVKTIMKNQNE